MKLQSQLSVVLAAAALLGGCGLFTSPPQKELERFLSLLKQGRPLDVQNELGSRLQRMVKSEVGALREESFPPEMQAKNMASYQIVGIEASDDAATAHVKIRTKDGQTHAKDIDLIRENGVWRISAF